jgi:hypothetical protein
MDTTSLILGKFELKKLSKTCNTRNCDKAPSKKAIITELDTKTAKKKDLVVLYFCNEHYNGSFKKFFNELINACKAGKIIDKRVFEIGYVTH